MMSATALEMLGEVVAVVRKRGLDPQPFNPEIMTSNNVRRAGAQNLRRQDREADLTHPDLSCRWYSRMCVLALAEAEQAGVPMPSVGVVRDRLITGIAHGYGELDWTALGLVAAEEAGLYAVPSVAAD